MDSTMKDPLTEEDLSDLKALVSKHSIFAVSRLLSVSRHAIQSALAARDRTHLGTRALLHAQLASWRGSPDDT